MLNAEIDHGTFVPDPKAPPDSGVPDWVQRQREKAREKKQQEKEQRKGSLIGKNDRSRMNNNDDTNSISGRIEDLGLNI